MDDLDDVIREFLVESHENLDNLDRDLLALEEDPSSPDALAGIFRTIHTIKGTCGFLGFGNLERLTHAGESLLSRMRDGEIHLNGAITEGLLALEDAIRQILVSIEENGQEGDDSQASLIEMLTRLRDTGGVSTGVPPAGLHGKTTEIPSDPDSVATPDPTETGTVEEQGAASASVRSESTIVETTIRVDIALLDRLMNLVGELVLARNQMLQFTSSVMDSQMSATLQRLDLITTDLQEGVMKTRMQPIGKVWKKFPRVVRELARSCGKQVRLELEGEETELDKSLLEAVKDPLTHCIRNAIDHGIEAPDVRKAAGKPAEGCVQLRAFHEGGHVIVEITDDGAGVDTGKIRDKAVEGGIVTYERAGRMSERDLLNLIFRPGFSTADEVTRLSGRGVGMDVVKANIERISGTVEMRSKLGAGTTLRIKIPLTLAIIPALVVSAGGERYAIPQTNLLELVLLEGEQARTCVERIHYTPVYRLRGRLLPLVYLASELGVDGDGGDSEQNATDDGNPKPLSIAVLQADDHQFGLVVDDIRDSQEIVVKPLGKELAGVNCFAGATIMGDGRVVLILDVISLAQRVHVLPEGHGRGLVHKTKPGEEHTIDRQAVLLFRLGENARMAVPLSSVARLEELPRAAVERCENGNVIQYRGRILPLVELASVLGFRVTTKDAKKSFSVLICATNGRTIGLVVDQILDVVEETFSVEHGSKRAGMSGTAVIQQRVTSLLDIDGLARMVAPTLGKDSGLDVHSREAARA